MYERTLGTDLLTIGARARVKGAAMLRKTWRSDNILVAHPASALKIATDSISVKTVVHAEHELSFHAVEALMRNASPGIAVRHSLGDAADDREKPCMGHLGPTKGCDSIGLELPETF